MQNKISSFAAVLLTLGVLVVGCSVEVHTFAQYRPTAKADEEPAPYTVFVEPVNIRGSFTTDTRFPNLADYLTESCKYYAFEKGLFSEIVNGGESDLVLKVELRDFNCEQENEGWGLVLDICGGVYAGGALVSLTTDTEKLPRSWPFYLGLSAACFVPGLLIPYVKAELEIDVDLIDPYTKETFYEGTFYGRGRSEEGEGFDEAMRQAVNEALDGAFAMLDPVVRDLDFAPGGGAGAHLSEATRIAILDFEPIGVPESEAATVSELFRSALFNTRRFTVIERSRMGEIFEEQGFVLSGCTDVECAVNAGKILDVEVILIGSLSKLGSKYILTVRGVDVSDARVVLNETAEHTGAVEDLGEVVNRLARKVAGGSGGM
jgi:TolB-like protein